MAKFSVGVTLEVDVQADSAAEAEQIVVNIIENCLDTHYIEAEAYEGRD